MWPTIPCLAFCQNYRETDVANILRDRLTYYYIIIIINITTILVIISLLPSCTFYVP